MTTDKQPSLLETDSALLAALLEHGPLSSAFILTWAARRGMTPRRLRRAKEYLGVRSTRKIGTRGIESWSWSLPSRQPAKPGSSLAASLWQSVGLYTTVGPKGESIITHAEGDEYAADVVTGRIPYADALRRQRRARR